MALTPEVLPMLFAGGIHLGLAAVLLSLGFHRTWNRAFALLLVLLGSFRIVYSMVFTADTPAAQSYWTGVLAYFSLTDEFALLYFASVFPVRRRWLPRSPWGFAPFLAAMLAVGGLFALDHHLYFGLAQPLGPFTAPLGVLANLLYVSYAVVPLALLRDARRGPAGRRHSVVLVAVALTFVFVHVDARSLAVLSLGYGPLPPTADGAVDLATILARLALFGAFTAALLRFRATADAELRAALRRYLALMGLALASGVALAPLFPLAFYEPLRLFVSGSWFVIAAGLVTYALVRHQLFDIDLRIKRAVREGTVAGAFVGAYVLTSVAAQRLVGGDVGPYLGIGAAVLLLFAIIPLQRLAVRVADAAMPRVRETPEYLNLKKLEVYRAALEESLGGGGSLTEAQAAVLARLRAELGITDRDHAVLEHAVRAGGDGQRPEVLEPGRRFLGRYRVVRALGEGGHGATFLCRDEVVERDVAIKGIRSPEPTPESLEAVLREARAIGAIRHPNVVTLHDVQRVGDEAFIIMEYLDGGSLAERLRQGPLEGPEFQAVAAGALRALEAVHAAGMVHRDVKPSNILLGRDGQPKLADFGIAHIPGFETTAAGVRDGTTAVGTIRFMSPEQALGRRVGPPSDLFSCAAALYEAYTGKAYLAPRKGESAVELQMRAAAAGPFKHPLQGPAALRAWFAKALDPAPGRRFASAAVMHDALERALAKAGRAAPTRPERDGVSNG